MNKATGDDGIPVELFLILKDDAVKCCAQYDSTFGKLSSGHRTEKNSIIIQIPNKGNVKQCSNYCTIALISRASKLMLKILHARFHSTRTMNIQMFKLDLEKAEEIEVKFPTSIGSSKKEEFQKNIYFCFIDFNKAFDCVDHNKLENSSRDGNA